MHFFDIMNYGKEHKVEFVFYNRYTNEIEITYYYNFRAQLYVYDYLGTL